MRSTELLCHVSGKINTPRRIKFPAAALQIRTEPTNVVRGGYRRPLLRGGRGFGRGTNRGGGGADRKCFNCDQSGFTLEHTARVIFVKKSDTDVPGSQSSWKGTRGVDSQRWHRGRA